MAQINTNKTLTTAEAEQVMREMPDWQKQKLADVLIRIARNHGWLETGESQQPEQGAQEVAQ